MNSYTYDAEGMLTATNSAQYVYDGLGERVQKTGGSNPTEVIYFNGHPIALLNATSGAWTYDLIWAGSNMVAEVPATQTALPVYRLLDHEGSLVATTDASGNVTGTNLMAPYGELSPPTPATRMCIRAYIRTRNMVATMPGTATTPPSKAAG